MATSPVASTPNPITSAAAANSKTGEKTANQTLAGNFQTFLTLLTAQLQNQNPLDPLDTNQFTQQLVQFAQVEQQLKQNDQLGAMLALQKSSQATQAINYVGFTATVDGKVAGLKDNKATWLLTSPKPATATVSVINSVGQTVYTGNFNLNSGQQNFIWDGKGNDGTTWPEGKYTMSLVAKDASNQPVTISTEVQGVVDAADLSQDPPQVTIGGQPYDLSQIKRVVRPGA
jgi:flagellar basal-body rod modification protein FlgD